MCWRILYGLLRCMSVAHDGVVLCLLVRSRTVNSLSWNLFSPFDFPFTDWTDVNLLVCEFSVVVINWTLVFWRCIGEWTMFDIYVNSCRASGDLKFVHPVKLLTPPVFAQRRTSLSDTVSPILVAIGPGVPPVKPKAWFSYVDSHYWYFSSHPSDGASCMRHVPMA